MIPVHVFVQMNVHMCKFAVGAQRSAFGVVHQEQATLLFES